MRSTIRARLAGMASAAVLLAGCSTSVAGNPTAAGAGSSEPAGTTQSTQPTQTSEPGPDTGALDCEGPDVVAPEDQPFCFTLPEGFRQDDVDLDNQAGSAASYTTGVLLSDRDVIVFSVYELTLDSDDLTDEDLTDALADVIAQLAVQGFDFTQTEPQLLEVDGARTFFYTGADASGLRSDTYFIFRGETELQVNCQWETMETEVLAGCEQVLDSLRIST